MSGNGSYKLDSLRPNRFQSERILLALAISLFIHVLIFGAYELNRELHWLSRLNWLEQAKKYQPKQVQQYAEPIEFVTVANPSTEAPAKPKYISNKNSVAADDSETKKSENPQLNGKQDDVPQTVDQMRTQIIKEQQQPSPAPQPTSSSQASAESKPAVTPGDLTMGKPNDSTQQQQQQEPPRPRTIKDALAQQMASHMPSMTMKQEGGARRHSQRASFDVVVTGFGDYDERFSGAVSRNWWNLLDSQRFAGDRAGKVVLLFNLNYDGRISDLKVAEDHVGPLYSYVCEEALLQGAPYERWSEEMRLKLGDSIQVQFSFFY